MMLFTKITVAPCVGAVVKFVRERCLIPKEELQKVVEKWGMEIYKKKRIFWKKDGKESHLRWRRIFCSEAVEVSEDNDSTKSTITAKPSQYTRKPDRLSEAQRNRMGVITSACLAPMLYMLLAIQTMAGSGNGQKRPAPWPVHSWTDQAVTSHRLHLVR